VRIGIILAGGRGERMGARRNKALLKLAGKPIVLHSVETFQACCDRLLVVAAVADLEDVRALLLGVEVVPGGDTRHRSEWNALRSLRPSISGDEVIAIHDAARPLVAPADVRAVFAAAEQHGAALLAAPADRPALEVSAGRVARAYQAGQLWRAQTPQAARASVLLDAYQRAAADAFTGTDTAAVLERYGHSLRVVMAVGENPKVTLPEDLRLAERLLAEASTPSPPGRELGRGLFGGTASSPPR
jgi:2-C-methyl-D-erythritol 4-phosphate cytidylyltransferase